MALWGNNDAVPYLYNGAVGGTVSVNYSTKVVTGTGTTFGTDGFPQEGDVIRIGFRGTGGTYFGDATIASIASTTSITIASTDGLSGAAIANTSYFVSELPSYTTTNPRFSEDSTFNQETQGYKTVHTAGAAFTHTGIGASIVALNTNFNEAETNGQVKVGDFLLNDGNELEIIGIGTANVRVQGHQHLGTDRFYLKGGNDGVPRVENHLATIYEAQIGRVVGNASSISISVTGFGNTFVSLASTASIGLATDSLILLRAPMGGIVGLSKTISAGISTGDKVSIQRPGGGYDAQVVAVNETGVSTGTQFQTGAGWVGVTTYVDNSGNLRVKKEILVAMSGITTGPAGAAGTAGGAYPPSDD